MPAAAKHLDTIEIDGQPCEVIRRDDGRAANHVAWVDVRGQVRAVIVGNKGKADPRNVVWAPLPGSQKAFISCPTFEVLLEGTRGGGKTESLLADFLSGVGQGYGNRWRGILFRRTYPELEDVINKSRQMFARAFPGSRFNEQKLTWFFPTGETLRFRHMAKASDYYKYHGHEYPWIGWEELTNWADDKCYLKMFSCCRSSDGRVPTRIRATTNPSGVGHNWVKARFQILNRPSRIVGKLVEEPGEDGGPPRQRRSIHSTIEENFLLLRADPGYLGRLRDASANDEEHEAWRHGRWDIIAGGFFSDVWDQEINDVDEFTIPYTWRLDWSLDWGDSHPFSARLWAESDGCDVRLANGKWMSTVRGDLFSIREWYGWNGKPNEGCRMLPSQVSAGIVERELLWGFHGRVSNGPADTQIWATVGGNCIATEMAKPVRVNGREYAGKRWVKADKSPGSVESGLQVMRQAISNAKPNEFGIRERPGLFVFGDWCPHFVRTVPVLPRCDKNLRRVADGAEDHACDETRYRLTTNKRAGTVRTVGMT